MRRRLTRSLTFAALLALFTVAGATTAGASDVAPDLAAAAVHAISSDGITTLAFTKWS